VASSDPSIGPRSYSTAYVARRLGISIPTVQRWVDSGNLVAWKTPGGHRRIEADSADRLFVARGHPEPAAASVVVIDDNPDDRDILGALVRSAMPDCRLDVFDSGIQALVAIGHTPPDIVITDLMMPHMNGIEVLRQLAGQCVVHPHLIIAVSSLGPQQLGRLGELPEGVRFVAKPIEPQPFIDLLRSEGAAG
jgi:excisionase family DNA binding protein